MDKVRPVADITLGICQVLDFIHVAGFMHVVLCHGEWIHHIPNFSEIRPAVSEIRKGVRTCARAALPHHELLQW